MREILFKAKRKDNGEWVEGYYCFFMNNHCILPQNLDTTPATLFREKKLFFLIDPETLCQYTGVEDMNGHKIWENDIIWHGASDTIGVVRWFQEDYVGWCIDDIKIGEQMTSKEMWNESKTMGNIFDDAEFFESVKRISKP